MMSIAKASVTNGVKGTGVYRGPGTSANGDFNPSVAGPGTHKIWYDYTTIGGCKASVSQNIRVYAKPQASFTYPVGGCLPTSGLAQFNNTSTVSDGQTLSYNWDFGDPNATVSNSNTSTLQHPTHNYKDYGTYNLKLGVTTENGCKTETVVTATFSVKPVLSYGSLSAVCEDVVSTISVAKATVTNGVTGTGVYRGPGTDASGNFNPSVAKAGTHTIWYDYTSAGGCKESISQTIVVNPKPTANFTVTGDICLNGTTAIADHSTVSTGNIVKWTWNLGDGTADVTNTNGNSFTKAYAVDKAYTIKLVTTSDKGCVSNPANQTVTVHPLPKADFELPAGICMPNGLAVFTNKSTAGDNAALSYQWNFGDGSALSTAANPSHTYAAASTYNVQLKVTSAYGCLNNAAKPLNAFYNKPVASFKVAPETLCQGADNVFTDLSTAPNSTIQGWNWVFADGSTSTTRNPVKKYTGAGKYDVTLTVTKAVGCASDPFKKQVVVYVQPVVDARPSFVVTQGTRVTFNPTVNDSTAVKFRWSPNAGLTNTTMLRPSVVATANQTYTLTATGEGNCTATDFLTVKILMAVKVPNAFSPNGDGVNDTWEITNLFDYPGATIEVFNRYGQSVYRSSGYDRPWDGTINGKPLPFGTYYYVITLQNGFKPITGSVTIVR